jgi:hypothetical protein
MRQRSRTPLAAAATLCLLLTGIGTLSLPLRTTPVAAAPVTPTVSGDTNAGLGDSPDPDIVRVGSTFYAFTTGTTWGNQIAIAQTTSANPTTGWTRVGSAFPQVVYTSPLAPWEEPGTTTSPGVFHYDNEWIMYYDADAAFGGIGCLSVATASSVTGPYTDNSTGPITCQTNLGGSLDPQPFVDPVTGDPYLIWKSNDGSSAAASQVWSQPIGSNGVSLVGSPTAIFTIQSAVYPWQTTTDDPSMAYAGGNYYLFFSGGDYQSSFYPTGYVVCSGPSGGCDPDESSDPILNADGGAGGGMVFSDASGDWWLSSQTWEPTSCTHYVANGSCVREMFIASISLPQLPAPSIATASLPPAGVGTPYAATLTAASGTAPYTWSILSGKLPSALSLNAATGAITGTAAATGSQSITFGVTDANGESGSRTLGLTVEAGSVTTASVNPTSITFGTSVTFTGSVAPFSSGGTPTGTVRFGVGATTLCTTPALTPASGQSATGACTAGDTPTGADTVTATYSGDATFAPSSGTASLVVTSGPYSPLTPVRICDTRAGNPSHLTGSAAQCDGTADAGGTIAAGGTLNFTVANAFAVPSSATAVVLNVAVVNPATAGYLTVIPTGTPRPFASNLNYVANQVVPNLVEVGTGSGGQVSIYSSARADVVVDLEGYVAPSAAGGAGAGLYDPLSTPARICDTRAGNPSNLGGGDAQCDGIDNAGRTLGAGGAIPLQVTGNNGVPVGATAAVLNVTVVNPEAAGYLTVYPQGAPQPFTANLNYSAGQVIANRVIVPLSTTGATPGQITVFSSAGTDVVVDVSGYYSAPGGTGTQLSAEAAPVRICDTRAGDPSGLSGADDQCDARTIASGQVLTVNVAGLAGVPSDASAAVINLTAVNPSTTTFLTVFPGPTRPFSSDLNPTFGSVQANLTVATLSSTGTLSVFNDTGSVDVVVDVLGWYS